MSKQKYYDIPPDNLPLIIATRLVLEAKDEDVPIEVLEDVMNRVKHMKWQPRYEN